MPLNSTFVLDLGTEIGIIYLGILIGYLFGKSRFYSADLVKKLSRFAIYVVFPPIIILNTVNIGEGHVTELVRVLMFSMVLHFLVFI